MANLDSTIPLKRCCKGDQCIHPEGCWLPATTEYFKRNNRQRSGLNPSCKACNAKYNHDRYYADVEGSRAKSRQSREKHKENWNHKRREKRRANPEAHRQEVKEWRERNPETRRAMDQRYYQQNAAGIKAKVSAWVKQNPKQRKKVVDVYNERRRAKRLSLPNAFTDGDWQLCLSWWGGTCAYCGVSSDKLQMDHFIPLSHPDCPGTIPSNIVPACASCNASKNKTLAAVWLMVRVGEHETEQVLRRINEYFQSLRD